MTKPQKIAWLVLATVPLACCGGVFVAFLTGNDPVSRQRDRNLLAARRAGLPTDIKDVLPTPVADADNAAIEYRRLAPKLKRADSFGEAMLSKATPAKIKQAKKSYALIAPLLTELATASRKPGCDFELDWSKGVLMESPEVIGLKRGAQGLAFQAKLRAEKGDWEGGLQSIATIRRLVHHLKSNPTLVSSLVQVSANSTAFRVVHELNRSFGDNQRYLAAAEKLLADWPTAEPRQVFAGEYAFGLNAIRVLRSLHHISPEDRESSLSDAIINNRLTKSMWESGYVGHFAWVYERLPRDSTDIMALTKVLREADDRLETDSSVSGKLGSVLMPLFGSAAEAFGKELALKRLCQTELALLRSRPFPAQLRKPLGSISTDPFVGSPFRYQATRDGYVLYSVGPDEKDDGGDPGPDVEARGLNPIRDIVLRFP